MSGENGPSTVESPLRPSHALCTRNRTPHATRTLRGGGGGEGKGLRRWRLGRLCGNSVPWLTWRRVCR